MDYSNKQTTEVPSTMARRSFLIGAGSLAVGLAWWFRQTPKPVQADANLPKTVTIVEFSDSGKRLGKKTVDRVVKTEAEWKQQLSPQAFDITRLAGTDGPSPTKIPIITRKGFSAASAATPRCSTPTPNSIPVRAGPVFGNPSPKKMF